MNGEPRTEAVIQLGRADGVARGEGAIRHSGAPRRVARRRIPRTIGEADQSRHAHTTEEVTSAAQLGHAREPLASTIAHSDAMSFELGPAWCNWSTRIAGARLVPPGRHIQARADRLSKALGAPNA